ncbi:hypothetical protein EON63_21455 [archaeon]|nr:MAG: hypothetical protein EON63_21455 [archaeon]
MFLNFCSKWQAIKLQFVTAIAAFLGTGVGLLALKGGLLEVLLSPITTGGFLYVAATSVLPDVLKGEEGDRRSMVVEMMQLLGEVGLFVAGVGLMLGVTYLE